jgi:hypothetical protein
MSLLSWILLGRDGDARLGWRQRLAEFRRHLLNDAQVVKTTIDTSRPDPRTASGSAERSTVVREGHDYTEDYT